MRALLQMRWVDLAFLHWRVPASALRPLVPAWLELDTFQGDAWIGVIPFRMTNVRPAASLRIPTASDFPELNVRTYVRHGSRAGVYFFSLDAASSLAVLGARVATGLPYFYARMYSTIDGGDVRYESTRTHVGASPARFSARYRPTGDVFTSAPGSLEHFLTERYSLFVTHLGRPMRLDIEHVPWPLQCGSADVEVNTMAQASGIELPPDQPHVMFARKLDVFAHMPRRARR